MAYGLSAVAAMFTAMLDFENAVRYADIAMHLAKEHLYQGSRATIGCYMFVYHWKLPFIECLKPLLAANKVSGERVARCQMSALTMAHHVTGV